MIDIFSETFTTATHSDNPNRKLTRVRDVHPKGSPNRWRGKWTQRPARYIDLNDL